MCHYPALTLITVIRSVFSMVVSSLNPFFSDEIRKIYIQRIWTDKTSSTSNLAEEKEKLLEKTMIPIPTLLYVCMEFELGWKPPAWLLWWEKDLILKLLRFTYKLLLHKFAPGLSTSFSTAKSGATKSALMTREDCYYASIFGAQLGSHPHCRWIPPSSRREDYWRVYCHVGFVFSMHAASSSKGDDAVWSLIPGNLLAKLQACFAMQQMH